MPDLVPDHLVLIGPARAVDHEEHHVDIAQYLGGTAVHEAVEGLLGVLVQAGGIHVDGLDIVLGLDSQQGVPGGLGLARGDRQLLSQDMVEQRRLAHIGPPDDCHIAATRRLIAHSLFSTPMAMRASLAASCSARRRLLPTPEVLPVMSSTRHSTRKVRQWASPLISTTS